jgi:hypothetical protein
VLLYLARRYARYLGPAALAGAEEACKSLVIETVDLLRTILADVHATARLMRQVWRALRNADVRPGDFLATGAVLCLVVVALAVLGPSKEDMESRREAFLDQVRIARANPPPPCVSDGDGGVWIDTGPTYVKQRDGDYARLRRELCGY